MSLSTKEENLDISLYTKQREGRSFLELHRGTILHSDLSKKIENSDTRRNLSSYKKHNICFWTIWRTHTLLLLISKNCMKISNKKWPPTDIWERRLSFEFFFRFWLSIETFLWSRYFYMFQCPPSGEIENHLLNLSSTSIESSRINVLSIWLCFVKKFLTFGSIFYSWTVTTAAALALNWERAVHCPKEIN